MKPTKHTLAKLFALLSFAVYLLLTQMKHSSKSCIILS